MIKKIKQAATCIVFYDFDLNQVDLKVWFEKVIELFESMGINLICLDADAEDIKWKKVKTFKYGKKFIEQRGFDNLESITVGSDSPPSNPESINREAMACIRTNVSNKSDMTFYVNQEVLPLIQEKIEKVVIELIRIVNPYYGFVHQREYAKGPIFYTWGTIMGLDSGKLNEKKERQKLTQWNHQYNISDGSYRTGLLRGIYPLNFLSQAHLKEPIYDTTLEAWIKSSPEHGDLKPLTQDLWSWWVPEENISLVTKALKDSNIILCT